MARLVQSNVGTNTGLNILNIHEETGINPTTGSAREIRDILAARDKPQEKDNWNCWLLEQYIGIRKGLRSCLDNTDYIDSLIESLCST